MHVPTTGRTKYLFLADVNLQAALQRESLRMRNVSVSSPEPSVPSLSHTQRRWRQPGYKILIYCHSALFTLLARDKQSTGLPERRYWLISALFFPIIIFF